MATKKSTSKRQSKGESAPKKLSAEERKIVDLYRKVQTQVNTPPAQLVETVTAEEKALLDAYRTGEHLPMHSHMLKYREAAELAFWRHRLADYHPLGTYDQSAAEHDHEPPTALEFIALHIAYELTASYWIDRHMIWGDGSNLSELVKEIAQAMLEGMQAEYTELDYVSRWLELDHAGLLPIAAKGGDDVATAH